jgi:hypothetical protein
MSALAVIGLITALAIVVFGVMMGLAVLGVVEDSMVWLTAGTAGLLKILDKAFKAIAKDKPKDDDKDDDEPAGPKALTTLIVLLVMLGGCATYDHAKAGAGAVVLGSCVSTCAATCAPELGTPGLEPGASAARYGLCVAACSTRCLPAAACVWTNTCPGAASGD